MKWAISDEDNADFEQERLIQQWLKSEGRDGSIDYRYINRKGNARNTLVKASISLDQTISDEGNGGTFADLIAGSDGRDLECGGGLVEPEPKTPQEYLDDQINWFFETLGVSEGVKKWAKKSLKSFESLRSLALLMRDDEPWEISTIDLESLPQLRSFKR